MQLYLSVTMCFIALSYQQQFVDVVTIEGSSINVFIPCTLDLYVAPFWIINGSVYDFLSIPRTFLSGAIPAVNSFVGIVLPQVNLELDGVTFVCATFREDGTRVLGGGTRLIVHPGL
jgi:hypothetical protein